MLKADIDHLQAFHMRSLRCILGVRWFEYAMNAELKECTDLEDMELRMQRRRLALFVHVGPHAAGGLSTRCTMNRTRSVLR